MEELIDQGLFHAALDLSAHEVTGDLIGGTMGAPDRLNAAVRHRLPQVVGPGGCDFMVVEKQVAESEPRFAGRKAYRHTPEFTLVRVNAEEMELVGRAIAERLNRSEAPAAVMIPTRGFSYADRDGLPLYEPESDVAFTRAVKRYAAPHVRVVEVDSHINDAPYADAAVELLLELMDEAGVPRPLTVPRESPSPARARL